MTISEDGFSFFGVLLKTFRKRQHLTQHQLAEVMGVHRGTIINWEQGSFLPGSKTLVLELARHLKLDDQETRQLLEASLTALAPHWLVPLPRNPFFTGREDVLERLHTQLGTERALALTQSSALHGLGGVGKTQLALEYAYRYGLEYSAVFWLGAETQEELLAGLVRVASVLQLPERDDKDQQRVVAAVQHWLATHDQWLVILDNVEELVVLDRLLPPTRQGAMLITTRCQTLGTRARGLDLWPMEQEEGLLFLLRRAKVLAPEATSEEMRALAGQMPKQYAAAGELVERMGGLPLALDQAGAYLEATRCGLSAYLERFRTQQAALLKLRGEGVREHPASVATTFRLAFTAITRRHPAVGDLLRVCALVQPDAIPEELFRQAGEHLGPQLQVACRDPLEWDRLVGVACSYSLLSRQPAEQALSLHRLVQAVLKGMLPEAVQHTWKRRVLGAMSHLFPSNEAEQADYWQRCERLLPHALLCLTWNEEEALSITLMNQVAAYFSVCYRLAEAEALYLQVVRLGEQTLGDDHSQMGDVLCKLATLYHRQGKYAEAETLYLQVVRLGEQTLGANHPQVATALQGLAGLYANLGRYPEAEPLYQRALSIREQTLGADHPQVATTLQGLVVLYDKLGRYPEAEPLHQRALSIREQTLGAEHPQVATVLHNLAESYREQGRYAETEPLFQRALSIWEQALGPDHPRVAYPLHSLGEIRREQGRYVEAEQLFQRALHIWEQASGSEDHLVAIVLNSLALLSQVQGRDAEAETLFQRALSIQEQHFDPQHPETAQTLHALARFRQQQGNLSEARSFAERARSIRSRSLGDTHPQTIATRTLYDQLLREQIGAQEKAIAEGSPEARGGAKVPSSLHAEATPSTSENDPLQAFLDACCERHPRAWCRSADLWQAYQMWAKEHQERCPLSRMSFTQQVKAAGYRTDRTNSARIWRGITLGKQETVTGSDRQ